MPQKWSNAFSYGHCYSTYAPTNSAASPERLKIDPTPFSNSYSYGHWYSTYGPTNSAGSPECLTNDQIPSLTATATLLTALLTLLLNLTQFLLLRPLLLYSRSYLLCCIQRMPDNDPFSSLYGHCFSTYGLNNSAASPECPTNYTISSLMATTTLLAPY